MEQLPQSQPLWEIHIIKYPTSHAAGIVIFKLHHSLGDGFSLMGALLSCLQRADNPSLPLTFPTVSARLHSNKNNNSIFRCVSKIFSAVSETVSDFCRSIAKSTLLEDDQTPIRSGNAAAEFGPMTIATMTFSLDHIKQIKTKVDAVRLTTTTLIHFKVLVFLFCFVLFDTEFPSFNLQTIQPNTKILVIYIKLSINFLLCIIFIYRILYVKNYICN